MSNESYEIDMVSIRLVKDRSLFSNEPIDSSAAAIKILGEELKTYDRELIAIVNLQTDGKPININIVSIGTINASLIAPREVFKSSILSNAAQIILLHNHPTGNCKPSNNDIKVTKKIKDCCELLGIKFLDHIIIGDKENFSFRENDMVLNNFTSNHVNESYLKDFTNNCFDFQAEFEL